VIHRDLKPANVMLNSDGTLKLTDFGLARSVESLKMTVHGQLLGTPRYMPSELLGGGEADERADLYALGLITWELLTGKPLFTANDIVSLLRQQMKWKLPERTEIREDLPEDIYQILQQTLSQQVEERTLDLAPLLDWSQPINTAYCTSEEQVEYESLDSTESMADSTSE
jgi:serine/threonine-protein kinase